MKIFSICKYCNHYCCRYCKYFIPGDTDEYKGFCQELCYNVSAFMPECPHFECQERIKHNKENK